MIDTILAVRKPTLWSHFKKLRMRHPPAGINIPDTPDKALKLGFLIGLQMGYGEGLIDGVVLGMDVGAITSVAGDDPVNLN